MKKFLVLQIALLAILLTSCGGNTKNVTVRDVGVYGRLNDESTNKYLSVDDGTYKFRLKDNKLYTEIIVTTIKKLPNLQLDEIDDFYIDIMDDKRHNIRNDNDDEIEMQLDNVDVIYTLLSSEPGDKNTLKFSYVLSETENILERIADFDARIDLELKEADHTSYSSMNSSVSNPSEWDKALDEYEAYIDKYISLYKKAMAGDVSAMTDYAGMLTQAEALSEKLEAANDAMTTAQMSRFAKLQAKLLNAL